MTMKERFATEALRNGATIIRNEDTKLEIASSNGKLITTYFFNTDGALERWDNNWVK